MLDIHVPEHATRTWRDFFIHIATIVVGLLIAIGLEQTVESIHEHHELNAVRQDLLQEQHGNEKTWAANESDWRRTFVELKNNLTVLDYIRRHPGTPQTALPGELRWAQSPFGWNHAVWDAAKQKGIVQRMPLEEANGYEGYYEMMAGMSKQSMETWNAINAARSFEFLDPDPTHLSGQQLDQVIQLTLTALQKHVTFGDSFGLYANEYPDRPHTITWGLIDRLTPSPSMKDPAGMAAANAITERRLRAANSGKDGTTVSPQALQ
ncbi:MAG: hypothetical protein ABI365_04660 [Lysobacteraceae bacterium]